MAAEYELVRLIEPLQEWYQGHARVLPWREEPTAYRVWISEIMLQQTRVEAVKPYFERFIRRLPDVRALAECPEDEYLKLWEGLGYYNRVRNLNAAAKQIMQEYGGELPRDYEELLKLKGVGHYTAGAIASIAYNLPVPAVDGNVLRVIMRVSADGSDIMKQSVRTALEQRLGALMRCWSEGADAILRPRVFNQALMELGALVCVPNGVPHCAECPWSIFCEARLQGRIAQLPVKSPPKERRIEEKTVFVIQGGDKVAIRKRADTGLLAGLYELPNRSGHLSPGEAAGYVQSLGYLPLGVQPLGGAKHVFSHVEWHMIGYSIRVEEPDGGNGKDDFLFVESGELRERYAIPNAFLAYARHIKLRE